MTPEERNAAIKLLGKETVFHTISAYTDEELKKMHGLVLVHGPGNHDIPTTARILDLLHGCPVRLEI